jgi:hypothetical protein
LIEGDKAEKRERETGREREIKTKKKCGGTATLPFCF